MPEPTIETTGGQFSDRDDIYQEFFKLQEVDGLYTQIATFTVSGVYSGVNVRINPSLIIVSGSDLPTLRIIKDKTFLSS